MWAKRQRDDVAWCVSFLLFIGIYKIWRIFEYICVCVRDPSNLPSKVYLLVIELTINIQIVGIVIIWIKCLSHRRTYAFIILKWYQSNPFFFFLTHYKFLWDVPYPHFSRIFKLLHRTFEINDLYDWRRVVEVSHNQFHVDLGRHPVQFH